MMKNKIVLNTLLQVIIDIEFDRKQSAIAKIDWLIENIKNDKE